MNICVCVYIYILYVNILYFIQYINQFDSTKKLIFRNFGNLEKSKVKYYKLNRNVQKIIKMTKAQNKMTKT